MEIVRAHTPVKSRITRKLYGSPPPVKTIRRPGGLADLDFHRVRDIPSAPSGVGARMAGAIDLKDEVHG